MYLHEREHWQDFTWDDATIAPLLSNARFLQGKLLGRVQGMGFVLQDELVTDTMTSDVIASSQIEGIALDAAKVRSSVARQLGVDQLAQNLDTHDVDGAVSLLLDATQHHEAPITSERLLGWHASLFPTGYSGLHKIAVGTYRTSPMSVVSGPIGHERVHYEAPDAALVPELMDGLIVWLNDANGPDTLLKAGIVHLWFLTIHPFDDGNGRIARALTELMLCRSDGSGRRFYSFARYVVGHRDAYYQAIERAQKGTPDITGWLAWFLKAIAAAVEESSKAVDASLARSAFWQSIDSVALNERQRKVLMRLQGGFEGKLTTRKWAKMCKVSPDTALRDINDLIEKGILMRDAAGSRSTSYSLVAQADVQ